MVRSYLGFDARPIRVTGAVRTFDLAPHWSRLGNRRDARAETQEHGIIEFEGGRLGVSHWTDVGYDSPLRWWRSSRFLAEKGMGIAVGGSSNAQELLTTITPDGEAAHAITLERRWSAWTAERCFQW